VVKVQTFKVMFKIGVYWESAGGIMRNRISVTSQCID